MSVEKNAQTVTMHGNVLHLKGESISTGDKAPNFTASKQDLSDFDFYSETKDKIKVISVVPSVDTGVCALQTQRFNQEATGLSGKVQIITISVDLPFALKRFCAAEGINNIQVVSDYKALDFGEKYGFIIEELKLLTRGIVIIDAENTVRYVEYVPEVSNHPDYDKAIGEIKKLI